MDMSYFQKINNDYKSKSRQETDLYLLNRHIDNCFADSIDYHVVKRNGEPFELLIIRDTDGNTYKKKIKSKNSDPFNLGDYIEWNGQTWIVVLLDSDDKTYHSGYMYQCTILLRWQNSKGEIVERHAFSEDFTKYSTGVTGNSTVTVGEFQYGITLPVDDETKIVKRDKRFAVDIDGIDPPDVYKLTNRKVLLTDDRSFGRGGILTWTLSYDAFNHDKDKKVTLDNGTEVWICDYIEPSTPLPPVQTTILSAEISGNPNLKNGFSRTYTATLSDTDGNVVEWDNAEYSWNISGDIAVIQKTTENKIKISVDDDSLIGESFLLQVIQNNDKAVISEIKITISDVI